ncbi:MAG: serine--tRNA ligase [bacterium]
MIDIKFLRNNPDVVRQALKNRNSTIDIDEVLKVDTERREYLQKSENLKNLKNQASKKIAAAKPEERDAIILDVRSFDAESDNINSRLTELEENFKTLMYQIPNVPLQDVPVGKDETENVVVRKVGEPPKFDFETRDHVELGKALDLIDNERASEISGARFTYLKGELALLEFALVNFGLSVITNREKLGAIIKKAGLNLTDTPFIPVIPPVMIKPEVFARMGRLEPKEERYYIPSDDLYLIGSAEHTLGPLHMDEIIPEKELPIRYAGFSTAFRREAGSYGKDMKGILRLHEFEKLELESFCLSENGPAEQELMVAIQEHLMTALELPYQVVAVCTGDMGSPDCRQIDIETWMPGQNRYRETHSADYVSDYQSRRLNIRTKREKETELVHMNDATAYAIGRTLIAIMENHQQADGSIRVPAALEPFYFGPMVIKPRE